MDSTEPHVLLGLLVGIIVAVPVLGLVFLILGMAAVGDGQEATTARDRWEGRLFAVGSILAGIIVVGLLIAAVLIVFDLLGGPTFW